MRVLCLVPLEVHLQVAFGGESVAAYVALEGSFACVRPDVDLEGAVTPKHFAAIATTMLKKWFLTVATCRRPAPSASSSATPTALATRLAEVEVSQKTLGGAVENLLSAALQ